MQIKKLHYLSGLIITLFIGMHLFNHVWSIFGAEKHIEMMETLRLVYRNIVFESILLVAVLVQIFSGIKLFMIKRKISSSRLEKLQIWSGLYLGFFFIIHLNAIFVGRIYLNIDTNFYFGVAGLNTFPFNLFFVPYYVMAILSFFLHISAVHSKKMKHIIFGLNPLQQSKLIFSLGIVLTFIIFYGLTNKFKGVVIPVEYNVLIGK